MIARVAQQLKKYTRTHLAIMASNAVYFCHNFFCFVFFSIEMKHVGVYSRCAGFVPSTQNLKRKKNKRNKCKQRNSKRSKAFEIHLDSLLLSLLFNAHIFQYLQFYVTKKGRKNKTKRGFFLLWKYFTLAPSG